MERPRAHLRVSSAELLEEGLRDEAYALVLQNEGQRLRKFACIDRGNTILLRVTDPSSGRARSWNWAHTYSTSVQGALLESRLDGPRTDVADVWVYAYQPPENPVLFRRGRLASITNPLGVRIFLRAPASFSFWFPNRCLLWPRSPASVFPPFCAVWHP